MIAVASIPRGKLPKALFGSPSSRDLDHGIAGRGAEPRRAWSDPAGAFTLDGRTQDDVGIERVDADEGARLVRDLVGRTRISPWVGCQHDVPSSRALVWMRRLGQLGVPLLAKFDLRMNAAIRGRHPKKVAASFGTETSNDTHNQRKRAAFRMVRTDLQP
jgi:hypothetical protein